VKYKYIVALWEQIPGVTTRRAHKHLMVVHAESPAAAEDEAVRIGRERGIALYNTDVAKVTGGTRLA